MHSALRQESEVKGDLWSSPQSGNVSTKQKDLLIALGGGEDDEDSEEDAAYKSRLVSLQAVSVEEEFGSALADAGNYGKVYDPKSTEKPVGEMLEEAP